MNPFVYRRIILFLVVFMVSVSIKAQDVKLFFNNTINNLPVLLSKKEYKNSKNQDFILTKIKYYVSNITLTDIDGKIFIADTSFLIDESLIESQKIMLKNIPTGHYQSIEFILGVDSLHNCSGAQSGSLDPLNGMFWTWNSGYIFFKLEGKSSFSNHADNTIEYHIGGYREPNNSIRKIMLQLDSKMTNEIYLIADIGKLFSTFDGIDFTEFPSITTVSKAHLIANHFIKMFNLEKQQ
ncbi:MAG: hypothetical protein FGM46_04255 [Ferruginibacter sp.]|nr:hypothetical protein [Ferruginibacter sp.]